MAPKMEEDEIGLILFHELQHITSAAGDNPSYPYGKSDMMKLANKDPNGARLNSNSYTMYIAQTGMSPAEYTRFTGLFSPNGEADDCKDKYDNCGDLAADCCYNKLAAGGDLL